MTFSPVRRVRTGDQQVLGTVMRQLAQNLLTDGCHLVEFTCRADECAYLLLLAVGQRRLATGSTSLAVQGIDQWLPVADRHRTRDVGQVGGIRLAARRPAAGGRTAL